MKAPFCSALSAMALAAGLAFLSGCTREPSHAPPLTKVVLTNASNPPPVAPSPGTEAPVTPPPKPPEAPAPTAKVAPQRIPLPPAVDEVVDLAQSQVGDAVVLEYIKKSTSAFELSADQIIYLKDIGMSEQVLAALVQRSQEIRPAAAVQPAPAPAEATPVVVASEPAPVADVTAPLAPTQPAAPVYAAAVAPSAAPAAIPETVYAQPVTQVTQNYFYSALSPYGAWVEIPSYGWCWQPSVAVVDPYWRPYCHGGRWLYTDCGWYWQSSYSWGWAPFHYGTWYRSPACGWVWAPGYSWAPAWVTWRYTGAYCGWAPLPPGCGWGTGIGLTYYGSGVSVGFSFGLGWDCFSFVHYRNFCDPHPQRHCLPGHESTTVYHNSTVINNYVRGHNNTIVNNGIAPRRITAVTRNEIRKVAIRDVTGEPNAPRRADRLERDGRQLAVYRPQPSAMAPNPAMPTSRPTQEMRTSLAPERAVAPRDMAEAASRVGAPLSSGRTRSESTPPTRTATPANVAPPSPAVGSSPARITRSEAAPVTRTANTPSTSAPARSSASINEVAPVRTVTPSTTRSTPVTAAPAPAGQANPTVSRPARASSEPAQPVMRSQPSRVERVAPSRTPTPLAPSGTSRSSGSVGPPGMSTTTSRSSAESRTPARTEVLRSEPRKLESAAPSYVPPPKLAPGGGSVYGPGSPPVSVPTAPRSPTPSVPAYQAPRGPSSVGPSAPAYSAPSRGATSPSSVPSYSPPSRSSGNAPAPTAPRSGGGNSGGGSRGRNVVD